MEKKQRCEEMAQRYRDNHWKLSNSFVGLQYSTETCKRKVEEVLRRSAHITSTAVKRLESVSLLDGEEFDKALSKLFSAFAMYNNTLAAFEGVNKDRQYDSCRGDAGFYAAETFFSFSADQIDDIIAQ